MSAPKGPKSVSLVTAVRAYVPRTRPRAARPLAGGPAPVLVLDTETTTDRSQALTFGSYRVYDARGELRQEGLIAADELVAEQLAALEAYRRDHAADNGTELRLLTRTAFVDEILWPIGYKARAVIVGHNLAFDLAVIPKDVVDE